MCLYECDVYIMDDVVSWLREESGRGNSWGVQSVWQQKKKFPGEGIKTKKEGEGEWEGEKQEKEVKNKVSIQRNMKCSIQYRMCFKSE